MAADLRRRIKPAGVIIYKCNYLTVYATQRDTCSFDNVNSPRRRHDSRFVVDAEQPLALVRQRIDESGVHAEVGVDGVHPQDGRVCGDILCYRRCVTRHLEPGIVVVLVLDAHRDVAGAVQRHGFAAILCAHRQAVPSVRLAIQGSRTQLSGARIDAELVADVSSCKKISCRTQWR